MQEKKKPKAFQKLTLFFYFFLVFSFVLFLWIKDVKDYKFVEQMSSNALKFLHGRLLKWFDRYLICFLFIVSLQRVKYAGHKNMPDEMIDLAPNENEIVEACVHFFFISDFKGF